MKVRPFILSMVTVIVLLGAASVGVVWLLTGRQPGTGTGVQPVNVAGVPGSVGTYAPGVGIGAVGTYPAPVQTWIPDALATQEAVIVALSATPLPPSPTITPIPPTPTRMPAGWERLEQLASGRSPETWDTGGRERVDQLYAYLGDLPGEVIASSGPPEPMCYEGPSGYRIEEVTLPGPVRFELGTPDYNYTVDKYYKVVITGGPFPEKRSPDGLIIDVVTMLPLRYNADRTEARMIYFELPDIYEGSTLGVSYPSGPNMPFPQKVQFKDGRPEQARVVPQFPAGAVSPFETPILQVKSTPSAAERTATALADIENGQFYNITGNVIAESQHPDLSCPKRPNGYKIEEIDLPRTMELKLDERTVTTNRIWKITIQGLEIPITQRPIEVAVCIGGKPYQAYRYSPFVITDDISQLRESDVISVARYSDRNPPACSSGTELPERLHFLANTQSTPVVVAPDPTRQACIDREAAHNTLYTSKGIVVAQGSNTVPTCFMGLTTYRIEEVTLPTVTTLELEEGPVTTGKFWRVTLISNKPNVGQSGYIAVDGTLLPVRRRSEKNNELTAIVFDRAILRDGALLQVAYSAHPDEWRETLPEKLNMP
jgi:hypothetical protein